MSNTNDSDRRYEKRIKDVEQYIYDHLDEPIDLNRLADIACLSPYHWHRIYRSIQGETVHATVSRLRLQHAAHLLASTELSLKQIARRAGYSAPPPFSRAFKSAYGISPIQYRKMGPHHLYQSDKSDTTATPLKVSVRTLPELRCVAIPHTGDYMKVDRAFSELFRSLAMAGALDENVRTLGVYFDDPDLIGENQLESLACATGIAEDRTPGGLEEWTVPGGLHAVLRHRGPYDTLETAYNWLFGHWLTQSEHEPADEPVYEVYINHPRDTAPMDLLVDICLPLVEVD